MFAGFSQLPMLGQVLIIAGIVLGAIFILSVLICVYHFIYRRKKKAHMEGKGSFKHGELPQVHFRNQDGVGRSRPVKDVAQSMFSWGSEFSLSGVRDSYANVDIVRNRDFHNHQSTDHLYANSADCVDAGGCMNVSDNTLERTYMNTNATRKRSHPTE